MTTVKIAEPAADLPNPAEAAAEDDEGIPLPDFVELAKQANEQARVHTCSICGSSYKLISPKGQLLTGCPICSTAGLNERQMQWVRDVVRVQVAASMAAMDEKLARLGKEATAAIGNVQQQVHALKR